MKKHFLTPSFKIKQKKEAGFTLIELLVVVAIIGLLSSIVSISLTKARDRGADAKRIADMNRLEIDANLSVLEKKPIPTISGSYTLEEMLGNKVAAVKEDSVPMKIVKYIGILPEDVSAVSDPLPTSLNNNLKNLFSSANSTGQSYFKAGSVPPEDPKCDTSNSATCYRAWYDGESIVIAATLRTKFHSSGKNVQYGIVIGKLSSDVLARACKNLNFPVYNTSADGSPGAGNPTCTGTAPASIIKGVTSGTDLSGMDSDAAYGY